MNFQGDVAGLGLAEVLQSIARGDKEGVLNLVCGDLQARVGMRDGMLYPLPPDNEGTSIWRERSARAWADDPQPTLETQRRQRISRAARIQAIYDLIESKTVRFHFVPGSLSTYEFVRTSEDGVEEASSLGAGIPVEFLLLEHARLSDEGQDSSAAYLEPYDLPHAPDPESSPEALRPVLAHCDGYSTLIEIADRLGWTYLQARTTIGDYIDEGIVQAGEAPIMLARAHAELEERRPDRAAARFAGWTRRSCPGPLDPAEHALLVEAWHTGGLPEVLEHMESTDARALLRRLDLAHPPNPAASHERWQHLRAHDKADTAALVREFLWRGRAGLGVDTTVMNDVLRAVRDFQERGLDSRARILLRLLSTHVPDKLGTRLELGERLIRSGLLEEGSRWLCDGARELIRSHDANRAMVPLRTVLNANPNDRDAHGLLIEAHAQTVRRRRRRYSSVIALAIIVILGMVAFVRIQAQMDLDSKLAEVDDLKDQPAIALSLLADYFGEDDDTPEVAAMRASLERRLKAEAKELHDTWMQRYDQVRQECEFGDPLLGLTRALSLPDPPELAYTFGSWPTLPDLLNVLAGNLQKKADALAQSMDATTELLHAEERLVAEFAEVIDMLEEHSSPEQVDAFRFRMVQLYDDIAQRRDERAERRANDLKIAKLNEQDMMLAIARAHRDAGDLERASRAYRLLLDQPPDPKSSVTIRDVIEPEVRAVENHLAALQEALDLARRGDHDEALRVLSLGCNDPNEHLMPWAVDSVPSQVKTSISIAGTRMTPFALESSFGEHIELVFEAEGYERRVVELDDPRDLLVRLFRAPERAWRTGNLVQAAPVSSGSDHIVADRAGRIARLDANGGMRWSKELESLGGIARTPVFLPSRPGFLLIVTEDGEAWLLDASNGNTEGPWRAESPPVDGPVPTRSGISVRFADGRIAVWSESLQPEVFTAEKLFAGADAAGGDVVATPSIAVLRRAVDKGNELASSWTPWTVKVRSDSYELVHATRPGECIVLRRAGEWTYVAWEAPNALVPQGRAWISDAEGLRAYLPNLEALTTRDVAEPSAETMSNAGGTRAGNAGSRSGSGRSTSRSTDLPTPSGGRDEDD